MDPSKVRSGARPEEPGQVATPPSAYTRLTGRPAETSFDSINSSSTPNGASPSPAPGTVPAHYQHPRPVPIVGYPRNENTPSPAPPGSASAHSYGHMGASPSPRPGATPARQQHYGRVSATPSPGPSTASTTPVPNDKDSSFVSASLPVDAGAAPEQLVSYDREPGRIGTLPPAPRPIAASTPFPKNNLTSATPPVRILGPAPGGPTPQAGAVNAHLSFVPDAAPADGHPSSVTVSARANSARPPAVADAAPADRSAAGSAADNAIGPVPPQQNVTSGLGHLPSGDTTADSIRATSGSSKPEVKRPPPTKPKPVGLFSRLLKKSSTPDSTSSARDTSSASAAPSAAAVSPEQRYADISREKPAKKSTVFNKKSRSKERLARSKEGEAADLDSTVDPDDIIGAAAERPRRPKKRRTKSGGEGRGRSGSAGSGRTLSSSSSCPASSESESEPVSGGPAGDADLLAHTVVVERSHATLPEGVEGSAGHVTTTTVTTRTAQASGDKEQPGSVIGQVKEKTFTATTTTSATHEERTVLTQEVQKTRKLVGSGGAEAAGRHGLGGSDPIVRTEAVRYDPDLSRAAAASPTTRVPVVSTETRKVSAQGGDRPLEGQVVSSQTVSSKQRTVETVTYKTEKDGVLETRVEQKITIHSDGEPIDHDEALRQAILDATHMNPDMTVEKIEIQQQEASRGPSAPSR